MVNKLLTVSSIGMFLNTLFCKNKKLKIVYFIGNTTSILNHSTTNEVFKKLDRSFMIFGAFVDTYYILNTDKRLFILLGSSIASFFLSKRYGVLFHLNSHLLINLLHLKLLDMEF
jgi:hypothetical protein